FLLRGGIVVAILPIVTLPSALALSNAFAPLVLPLALGRIDPAIVLGPAAIVLGLLLWLVVGGRSAAGIDVAVVPDARQSAVADARVGEAAQAGVDEGVASDGGTSDEDGSAAHVTPPRHSTSGLDWRVLALRLIAWLPLALAIGFGVAAIVEVTYAELTHPV